MFELDAIKLQVDTSQLDNAVKQIDALKKATEQVGREVNRGVQQPKQDSHVKAYTKSIEEQYKSVDKLDKLYSKLDQTILDLANEFTKGESSVLRYARSLGATKDQMQEVEARLTKLRPLVKDPFDSAIGSVRRISQEFNELQNRQDLLSKGFHLSSKELREYSRIALEVEAKMQAAGKDTKGADLQAFKAKVAEEQTRYLETQQAVSAAKTKEAPITKTSAKVVLSEEEKQSKKLQDILLKEQYVVDYVNKGFSESNAKKLANYKKHLDGTDQLTNYEIQIWDKQQKALQEADAIKREKEFKKLNREVKPVEVKKEIPEVNYNQQYLAYQSYEIKKVKARQKAEEDIFASLEREKDRMNKQVASMASTNVNATKIQFLQQQESKYMDRLKAKGVDVGDLSLERRKQLSEYLTASDKMWEANNRVGKSSREMAFAMRQVPMQITDIVTSLAAGQPPMQVFLQQGGQLKDLFGGVKEAAVALGKGLVDSVAGGFKLLLSPIGLAVTSLGTIGSLVWAGQSRNEEYSKSIILLGKSTALTSAEVEKYSIRLAEMSGVSEKYAFSAFLQMAKDSGLAGEELAKLTTSAINLEKYGGQSLEETVKKVASLKGDPIKAMQDLNSEIGFLTPALVKSTFELMQQGKTAEASANLIDAYQKSIGNIGTDLDKNLGATSRLWISIKEGIVSATDALINFFNTKPADSQHWTRTIKSYEEQGREVPSFMRALAGEESRKQQDRETATQQSKQAAAQLKLRELVNQNIDKYKTNENKAKVAELLSKAGDLDPALAKQVEELKKSSFYTGISKGESNKAESEKKRLEALTTTYKEEYAKQINLNTSYTKDLEDLQKIRNKLSTEEYAAAKRKIELGGDASAVKGIEEQYAVILNQGKQVNRDYADQLRYIKEARLSESERAKALQDLENKQPYAVQAKFLENVNSQFKEQVDLQILQIENQNKSLAISEKDRLIQDALLKVEQQRLQLTNDINNRSDLSEGQKSLAISNLNAKAASDKERVKNAVSSMYDQTNSFTAGWNKAFNSYTDAAKNAATMGESFFSKMADGMTDSILQFVKTGKLSFSDFATSIISDLLRIQIKQQVVGLMGNSTGGLGGLFNLLKGGVNTSSVGPNISAADYASQDSYAAGLNSALGFQANGGVWSGGIQKFANGGVFTNTIVNSPTLFGGKFANGGKFGLMGEAGPEAIMPLSRDSSGRLGVSMHNASSSGVSVVINNTGTQTTVTSQTEVTDSRGNRRIELTLADAVSSEQARHGSAMYNSTKNTFGLKPTLVGR